MQSMEIKPQEQKQQIPLAEDTLREEQNVDKINEVNDTTSFDKEKKLEELFIILSEPLKEFFNRVQDLREDYTATGDDGKIDQIKDDIRDKYLDGLTIKDYFKDASEFDLEKLVRITLGVDDPEEFRDILMLDDNQDLLLIFKRNIAFIQNRPKTEPENSIVQ